MTDFMNLKINSVQSFRDDHRGRMYVHVFIEMSDYTRINIYIFYCVSKKIGNGRSELGKVPMGPQAGGGDELNSRFLPIVKIQ
jgi:hypothetical protein